MKKLIILFIISSISSLCSGQTATSTVTFDTVTVTKVLTSDSITTTIETPFVYKSETIKKSNKFDCKIKENERVYTITSSGTLITFTQAQLEETIRILNSRKLKGENVTKELIINTERLKKLKTLQK